ncbi:ABC transporter transmembrane domain-containing protein [Devosia aurantiaca]|uniref:ABC transporter transmembrane domain-containing protein n=1 Tax=Devosia aurantiaca TaxID=2714858 RepID=UPI001A999FC9|nr:ABC transporter transmembrane domain-containing protein [Devosia aurantiaca]
MLDTFQKLRALLKPREQRQALLLLAMMLVLGVVEMAGVASIFPLIAVLSDSSLVYSNTWLNAAYKTLGFTNLNTFFIFLSLGVFAVIVLRTVFTAFTSYGLLRYAYSRSHGLSVRLLGSYLRRPYTFFLNRHTADMGKTVLSEVEQVINGSLIPALQFVSKVIVSSFLIAVVVIVDPTVAAIALVGIVGAYGLVYFAVRGYLGVIGTERIAANRERYRIAQEVLAGVKEVKVGGLERGYLRRFEKASLQSSKLLSRLNLVREVPRHMLELIGIGGVLAVIIVLLFRAEGDFTSLTDDGRLRLCRSATASGDPGAVPSDSLTALWGTSARCTL